jgi:phospholipid/cholesterol/gamma-HCH transport system substrate-binding protein
MGRNLIETLMGAIVLAVAGLFLVFAYDTTKARNVTGYPVIAKFDRIDGLPRGAEVRMSGIRIGTVVDQRLDHESFRAELRLSIDPAVKIPDDSVARIAADGLFGAMFVAIQPGGDDKTIRSGGEIKRTQGPIDLAEILAKVMAGGGQTPAR